jgi:hypothetical protein
MLFGYYAVVEKIGSALLMCAVENGWVWVVE